MLLAVMGLALTLLTLCLLAAGGYLLALRLLGAEARRDPLALAIAALLAATAEALAIGLAIGSYGALRIEAALSAQTLLVTLLGLRSRTAADLWEPARHLGRRAWERLRAHPALSLLTVHAVGSEALRGLLRPPLSWDSLMYHLLLSATWLQRHDLAPVFGAYPVNDYGYVPANGSIWFWWWMAPSHSELYVNLASLAHWALLGLAVGGIARQLGARRHWPLASFLVLLTPVVVRFAATQYVDIFVAATLLAGAFFALRWMERPRLGEAALAGAGCGLACGAKLLGVPYAAALAAAAVLLSRGYGPAELPASAPDGAPSGPLPHPGAGAGTGRWRRQRLPQLAIAALIAAALGSFFYLRNIALGAGPLALACEGREGTAPAPAPPPTAGLAGNAANAAGVAPAAAAGAAGEPARPAAESPPAPSQPRAQAPAQARAAAARPPLLPALPRRDSVADRWSTLGRHQLLDAFLGIIRPQSVELGAGPQALVLLLAFLALPFGVAADRRRAALVAASQIAFELLFWLVVPFAANLHLFANIRYLIPAIGLAAAGGVAVAEQRGMSDPWLRGIALALACQGLLQLHAEMPYGVRVAIAAADLAAVVLWISPSCRGAVRRHAGAVAAAAFALALLGAPLLARFRARDRPRALAGEWTAHATSAHMFAGAWGWLDAHGDDGTVDVVGSPGTYFVYPAMGPFLERQAIYVNVNRANLSVAARYPACNPRVDPSEPAWLDNLAAAHVRWLLLCRYPEFQFPVEGRWAVTHPDRFAVRYADPACIIFEVLRAPALPPPNGR